ncbi:MAG: hypothetical protein LBT99_00335 [Bifidobacteriaceae bacterium]|nr:hypothetical protein [Bifidobacteriaceae bacterium]
MAGITVTNEKAIIRLYRTFSYRDLNNKPQRVHKAIGKVDNITGKIKFNKFLISILQSQNLNIDEISNIPYHELSKIVNFGFYTKDDIIDRIKGNINGADYVKYQTQNNDDSKKTFINDQKKCFIKDETDLIIQDNDNNNEFNNIDKIINFETFHGAKYTTIESNYSCKGFGPKLILEMIINKTGLQDILSKVFSSSYGKILTLAFYLISDTTAVTYCEDWLEKK